MHPNIIIQLIIPSWHAMAIAGFVVAAVLSIMLRPKDFVLKKSELFTLALFCLIGGYLGAKILFLMLHPGKIDGPLWKAVISSGGFAFYGAFVSYFLIIIGYSLVKRVSMVRILDYTAPFLALSQMFVRIGCFMVGCCYGKPTNLPTAVTFTFIDDLPRHPTQLYSAALLLILSVFLYVYYNKNKSVTGKTFFLFLTLYGFGRFFIEFLRADNVIIAHGISATHLAAAAVFFVGFVGSVICSRKEIKKQ
jgi:phosphatidylglycerol---prolipoprotein diacylglyceryl transferase